MALEHALHPRRRGVGLRRPPLLGLPVELAAGDGAHRGDDLGAVREGEDDGRVAVAIAAEHDVVGGVGFAHPVQASGPGRAPPAVMRRYRELLRIPGVAPLLLAAGAARLPYGMFLLGLILLLRGARLRLRRGRDGDRRLGAERGRLRAGASGG